MARVLRLVGSKGIFSEPMGKLILGHNVLIPAEKNQAGVFIDHSKSNQKLLESYEQSYIPGSLETKSMGPIFFRDEPKKFRQLDLGKIADIGIGLPSEKSSTVAEEFAQMDILSLLVEKFPAFEKHGLVCVPIMTHSSKSFRLEMFDPNPGCASGVHVLNDNLGLVKLQPRFNHVTKNRYVALAQRFEMLGTRK